MPAVYLDGTGTTVSFSPSSVSAPLISLELDERARKAIESTHLATVLAKTYRPGQLIDYGTATLLMDCDPDDARLLQLPPQAMTITYPAQPGRPEGLSVTLVCVAISQGAEEMRTDGRVVTRIVFKLYVEAGVAPVITSPLGAGGAYGQAFSYQITATGNPTYYSATGLPPGLSVNPSTGAITGTVNYATSSDFTTVGAATISGAIVTLVEAIPSQQGAAWLTQQVDVGSPFEFSCDFRVTGSNAADGVAAVIQRDGPGVYGAPGRGIGYLGLHGVAFEVDDFGNLSNGDTSGNHAGALGMYAGALEADHSLAGLSAPVNLPFFINDGQWHSMLVSYNGTTLTYYVGGNLIASVNMDVAAYIGEKLCWVGFTSSTGGFYAQHQIRNLSMRAGINGSTSILVSASNINGTGSARLVLQIQ